MKTVVRQYLDTFFNRRIDFDAIRQLLSDDFVFQGPLMAADSADDFIGQLKKFGDGFEMHDRFHELVGEGDIVVARYDFLLPGEQTVPATEWYRVRDGKIEWMQLYCDPSLFGPA